MSDLFIGIDQSYSAFAIAFYNPHTDSHEVVRKAFPADKYGPGIDRLIAIQRWIHDEMQLRHQGYVVRRVAMEGYARERKNGREESGELAAIVKLACYSAFDGPAQYPTIIPPNSLKKYVTGDGRADKARMLLAVYKKWNVEFKDHNEADAYGLARMAHHIEVGMTGTKYELEVLSKLSQFTGRWMAA